MNIPRLKHLLETASHLPPLDERHPQATLKAIEAEADAHPYDPRWSRLIRALHGWTTAEHGLASDLGGVHRTRLVRWDTWTTTWEGRDLAGKTARIRILRPHAAKDAVLRRTLHREARALEPLVAGLTRGDTWLRCPSPGEALPEGTHATGAQLARYASSAIACLQGWEAAAVWPAEPTEGCWRVVDDRLVVVCLTAESFVDAGATLQWLGERLAPPDPETALERWICALASAPPADTETLAAEIADAMADDLTATRHDLALRFRTLRVGFRAERLLSLIQRLEHALPLPHGRGATGVDMDGQITVLHADAAGLSWGPEAQQQRVWSPSEGMNAPLGRRVLRARASAPPNPRLDDTIGGDPEFTRHAMRWLASRMRARTLRLLLKRQVASEVP